MVSRTKKEDGNYHASNWWFIENDTPKNVYSPSLDKIKGHGKAVKTLKQLNTMVSTSGASRLMQIHDAAQTILDNVHFKGEWNPWIWNILQYIPLTPYWNIRRLYNKTMKKIDLSEVVLYKALPEKMKQGIPEDPTMEQIHSFFSNASTQKKLQEVKNLSLHLAVGSQLTLQNLSLFSHLESLVITGGEITLPRDIAKLKHLSSVAINNSYLKELPDTLKNMDSLRSLSFGHTPLSEENLSLISTLPNITHLDLTDAVWGINFSRKSFFKSQRAPFPLVLPDQITHLILKHNGLKKWPENIALPKHLEVLDIGNNDFSELPPSLGNLTDLRILRCNNPQSIALPKTLANCQKLESIEVSQLDVNSSIEFKNLIKDFRIERLAGETTIPPFHEWQHLKNLELKSVPAALANKLSEELEKTSGNDLEHINLDLTSVSSFPQNIATWKNLKSVTLNLGKGQSIPKELLELPSLQFLEIHGSFKEIPDLSPCKQLKHLALISRELEEFPNGIENLSKLETLILDGSFKQFFDISSLQNLKKYGISFREKIDLSNGNLTNSNLKELEITGYFLSLPNGIETLKNLENLKITSYPIPRIQVKENDILFEREKGITSLPKGIELLKNLQKLSIRAPDVKELPPEILRLQNLKELSLNLHKDALSKTTAEHVSSMISKQFDRKKEEEAQSYYSNLSWE